MEERKILHDLVKKEAKNLRQNATEQELERLNLRLLDSNCIKSCVYGQMTGDCLNERANELILRCATKIYDTTEANETNSINVLKDSVLSGGPYKINKNMHIRVFYYVSPIEKFINIERWENVSKLVKYLKKQTNDLKFV